MREITLALACLFCAGHGRRLQNLDSSQWTENSVPVFQSDGHARISDPLKMFASFLALHSSAAFVPSSSVNCGSSPILKADMIRIADGGSHMQSKRPSANRWQKRITHPSAEVLEQHPLSVRLSNGFHFPLLGFGTWGLRGSDLQVALTTAVKAGYGLIDTSSTYGNEATIGQVLKKHAGTEKLVLQSKISPRHMGQEKARAAAQNSIKCMGRVDVLLIHWPGRSRKLRFETWQVLEDLYMDGFVQAIGVSNFLPKHIEDLMKDGARIKPMTNQFEVHPLCQGRSISDYCLKNDIAVQSYSTLGGGPAQGKIRLEDGTSMLLNHPVVVAIAKETGRSCACVCLRWAMQQKFGVIPKSNSPDHIKNNVESLEFALTEDQMLRLCKMDEDHHFAWDPRSL